MINIINVGISLSFMTESIMHIFVILKHTDPTPIILTFIEAFFQNYQQYQKHQLNYSNTIQLFILGKICMPLLKVSTHLLFVAKGLLLILLTTKKY